MGHLTEKLQQLLAIINIPLEEQWEGINKDTYNIFSYWKTLELIDGTTLEQIYTGKQTLKINPIITKKFANIDYFWPTALYKDGIVADIGSGFGYFSYWFILSGAKQVLSIGDPIRMKFVMRLYQAAVKKGYLPPNALIAKDSFVSVGDTSLSNQLEPETISLVFMHDTLEHITPRIFPFLVKSCHHSLKKGGQVISMQLNSDSPRMLAKIKKIWARNEANIHIPYRRKHIAKALPNINQKDLEELTLKTRGLDSIDFQEAIDNHQQSGTFPTGTENLPAIDLQWDVPDEGDTGIKRILSTFKKNGFKAYVYPEMRHSTKSKYFQFLGKLFPSLFFKWQILDQTSIFVATKQ